jgi:hypothetical protein
MERFPQNNSLDSLEGIPASEQKQMSLVNLPGLKELCKPKPLDFRSGQLHVWKCSMSNLSQLRLIDSKRLDYKIGSMKEDDFAEMKKRLIAFLK